MERFSFYVEKKQIRNIISLPRRQQDQIYQYISFNFQGVLNDFFGFTLKLFDFICAQQRQIKIKKADSMTQIQLKGINDLQAMIKNPSAEELKAMEWGVNLGVNKGVIINGKGYPYSSQAESQAQKRGEDGRHYYTEYSQVSAIETGFKKLKTNQIEILKQLKKQYQVLKNSSLDSRIALHPQRLSTDSESVDSRSQSDIQSSVKSRTNRQHSSHKHSTKELRLLALEKKQLELMLANSMKKIEQLLHSQMELKRNLIDAKSKFQSLKTKQAESEAFQRRNRDGQEQLSRTIQQLHRINDDLRGKINELRKTEGSLEGALNVKQLQLRKKEEAIRILQQQIHLQRGKRAVLQLSLSKIASQKQLLQKSKDQQLSLLSKSLTLQHQVVLKDTSLTIKRLQDQIATKDQRYQLLLSSVKDRKGVQPQNQQDNLGPLVMVLNKLSEMQGRPDQQLLGEITAMRREMQKLKEVGQSKETSNHYERRIQQLQEKIERENVEKGLFMSDVQKLMGQLKHLRQQRQDLLQRVKNLEEDNRSYRSQIDSIRNVNIDLTQSQHQNKSLLAKLQHFNLKQLEVAGIRQQLGRRAQDFHLKQNAYEQQIRLLKRKLNQVQIKAFKEHEEYEVKIKLLIIEHQNEQSRIQKNLQILQRDHDSLKVGQGNDQSILQKRYNDKVKEVQQLNKVIAATIKDRDEIASRIKNDYEIILRRQQQRHNGEVNSLVYKIQGLTVVNERWITQSQKYAIIQQQATQLKNIVKLNRKITQSVDHLWQVKEAQYSNINQILKIIQN